LITWTWNLSISMMFDSSDKSIFDGNLSSVEPLTYSLHFESLFLRESPK
jgi:hypothetical protein